MALPVSSFFNLPAGNQPLSLLDQQFTAIANGMTISCAAVGTNTIALTPNPNNYVPTVYTNGAPRFVWVQQATSTVGPVTVNVAGLGPITAYKQNGSVALGGMAGELIAGGVYTATYSSALTAGAGGFSIDLNAPGAPGAAGPIGPTGPAGPAGPTAGLPAGGAINQVLAKNSAADYDTSWQTIAGGGVSSFNTRIGAVTLTAADVTGVGGALLASPTFTGTPAAPTATTGTNTTQIATTSFVMASAVTSGVIAVKVFATVGTATYTPTAGMKSCLIEAVGGGAGGCGMSGAASTYKIGGGGGSGAYSRKFATAAMIGASQVVTIGAGGGGGAGTPTVGGAGGDTSVGTLCVARGAQASGSVNSGGAGGGVTGTGDYQAVGMQGGNGLQLASAQGFIGGGAGGNSMLGVGGGQTVWSASTTTGNAAPGYGGGGSGGSIGTTGGVAGGAGAQGCVIITEFG